MTERIERSRGILDGAESLEQAVLFTLQYADHLKELTREGWTLVTPVEGDYMILEKE